MPLELRPAREQGRDRVVSDGHAVVDRIDRCLSEPPRKAEADLHHLVAALRRPSLHEALVACGREVGEVERPLNRNLMRRPAGEPAYEILKFCPKANVGYANNNIKDIRWVLVPHNGTLIDEMQHDGDWIIEVATGHWVIKSDTEFHREYVIA